MEIPVVCSPIPLYKEYLGDNAFYYSKNIDIDVLINYALKYKIYNKDLILNKFDKFINLNILLNLYNNINI